MCWDFPVLRQAKRGHLLQLRIKLAEKEAAEAERARCVKDTTSFLLACMEDVKAKVIEVDIDSEQKNGDNSMRLLPGNSRTASVGICMLSRIVLVVLGCVGMFSEQEASVTLLLHTGASHYSSYIYVHLTLDQPRRSQVCFVATIACAKADVSSALQCF
jgi:hypothetical protein